ncbi:sulfotransferase family 2 domain-containing protein [Oceanibium sediminis]|uniref:sulfotransferase family 2 domain-containing protein n=1 Tax=Oceanibium sediminis TaxID=2026339 RepID=UPI000DD47834|nr:sulfotransferase family 2 domain-containing protein [Oceanibium sediminis]
MVAKLFTKDAPRATGLVEKLTQHFGEQREMNHNILVSAQERFIYMTNPKVACSSTKATLNLAHAQANGIAHEIGSMAQIHARWQNPLKTPSQIGFKRFEQMLAADDVFRFTFTREPVARFYSAYLSKLAKGKRRSGMAQRLWAHMGWSADYDLTIEEFADLCANNPVVRDFDPHWQLQRKQIAYDLIDFSYLGDHKQYGTDFPVILQRLFGKPVEIFDSRVAFKRFTKAGAKAEAVSDELRRKIEHAYAADYEMLAEISDKGLDRLPG